MTATVPLHADPNLACRQEGVDPGIFFPPTERGSKDTAAYMEARAKRVCRSCLRRADCLRWAIDTGEVTHGIIAGYTPRERTRMLKLAEVRSRRPARPTRNPTRWGWSSAVQVDPDRLRRLANAARHVLQHGDPKQVAADTGLDRGAILEMAAITRWAPDLVQEVLDGWVSTKAAYQYAQQLRLWTEQQDRR